MTIIKTALKNIRKDAVMNLFTMFEMMAVILLVIVMVSSMLIRYRYYTPFQDMFQSKGIYAEFSMAMDRNAPDGVSFSERSLQDNEIFKYLSCPDIIAACNAVIVSYEGETINNYCYNDEVIRRFTPEMAEGRWLNESRVADHLEVVVSQNNKWKVGDRLSLGFYCGPEVAVLEAEVVGVLQDNSRQPGGFGRHEEGENFNLFFQPYSYETEETPLMLFSSEYLKTQADGRIVLALFSGSIITYPDDTEDEVIEKDIITLSDMGCLFSIKLEDMEINNQRYLYEQLYNFLPIILTLLIMIMVSSISTTALSTRRRLKDYTVYYITGLRWRQCAWINFIQSVIISGASVILSFFIVLVIKTMCLSETITILWGGWTAVFVTGMILVYLLFSMLMPVIIIGRNSPKQILVR